MLFRKYNCGERSMTEFVLFSLIHHREAQLLLNYIDPISVRFDICAPETNINS